MEWSGVYKCVGMVQRGKEEKRGLGGRKETKPSNKKKK